MNTNYKQIKSYISAIEKYQIKSKELDENNNKIENISINYKLLNEDINNIGIKQAQEASKKIKNLNLDLIICSPLLRTRHTCDIINSNKIKVIYDDRIEERNCGVLTNTKIDNFYYTEYWNYYSKVKIDNLETVPELFKRVNLFLDEIKKKYRGQNILLVTHGGVARAIHFYFNELPEDGQVEKYLPDNCEIREYSFN